MILVWALCRDINDACEWVEEQADATLLLFSINWILARTI